MENITTCFSQLKKRIFYLSPWVLGVRHETRRRVGEVKPPSLREKKAKQPPSSEKNLRHFLQMASLRDMNDNTAAEVTSLLAPLPTLQLQAKPLSFSFFLKTTATELESDLCVASYYSMYTRNISIS